MIISLEGETSTWKSSFIYSAPPPIVCFAFDAGAARALDGANWKMFKDLDKEVLTTFEGPDAVQWHKDKWHRNGGKNITIYYLPDPIQTGLKVAGMTELWQKFTGLAVLSLMDMEVATTAVDTMTLARRAAINSHLQHVQIATPSRVQLLQVEYGKPNDQVRSVYGTAQNQVEVANARGVQKHFIVTHHMQDKRVQKGTESHVVTDIMGNPVREFEGLTNSYRFVDLAVEMKKVQFDDPFVPGKKLTTVVGKINKCGYDLSLEGTEVLNPTWDTLITKVNTNLSPTAQIELRGF